MVHLFKWKFDAHPHLHKDIQHMPI